MKITTDYHIHTTFSPDGKDDMADLCQRALELGLTEIAFTEHAEWFPYFDWSGFPKADAYFAEIDRCRSFFGPLGLTIYAGVELGNPHSYPMQATALLQAYPFDIVLASLHWLYGENIHLEPCFAGRNPDDVYADYFTALGQMACDFNFDVVAHFDRIFWRGTELGTPLNPHRLETVIRRALAKIAASDRVLELNTRFLTYEPSWNDTLVTILTWFRAEGGTKVAVNSDTHNLNQLGRHMDIAATLLEAAGFTAPFKLSKEKQVVAPTLG